MDQLQEDGSDGKKIIGEMDYCLFRLLVISKLFVSKSVLLVLVVEQQFPRKT